MEIKIQTQTTQFTSDNADGLQPSVQPREFSGPLDLLLQLIEQQEMDITQISLAAVTEQFLQHVRAMESSIDASQLADYLSIAAKLLVLKSKQLLPTLEIQRDEEEPAFDLAEQLHLYKQFKEAAKFFKKLDGNRLQSFQRDPGDLTAQRTSFYPDTTVTPERLHESIRNVAQALQEIIREPEAYVREVISIQDKIVSLQQRIASQAHTLLSEMISEAKNKTEVIVTFLAILELTKQRIIVVEQDALFSDISISKMDAIDSRIESHSTYSPT